MQERFDLHTHTNCSDGAYSPEELLRYAHKMGLKGLSITDHDTVAAYTEDLFLLAQELDLVLVPGVEISSRLNGEEVHILGYGMDLKNTSFLSFLEKVRALRNERNRAILEKLASVGIKIEEKELISLANTGTIGRPHIAYLLMQKGYVASIQEAFRRYLSPGSLCYAETLRIPPQEAIERIHGAQGKAIIAHPFFLKKKKTERLLLSLPFDGVEGRYAKLFSSQEKIWIDKAHEKGWLVTGGSDFHGTNDIPLGASWVTREVVDALF